MAVFRAELAEAIRLRQKLTREELAVGINRSYSCVVKIARGEMRPSLVTLGAMARVLDCSVADFFAEDQPDLAADDDPRPSDLGRDVDAWVRVTLASMPPMTAEAARRVSAAMFKRVPPPTTKNAKRAKAS